LIARLRGSLSNMDRQHKSVGAHLFARVVAVFNLASFG
jgi:hypothetical protein